MYHIKFHFDICLWECIFSVSLVFCKFLSDFYQKYCTMRIQRWRFCLHLTTIRACWFMPIAFWNHCLSYNWIRKWNNLSYHGIQQVKLFVITLSLHEMGLFTFAAGINRLASWSRSRSNQLVTHMHALFFSFFFFFFFFFFLRVMYCVTP